MSGDFLPQFYFLNYRCLPMQHPFTEQFLVLLPELSLELYLISVGKDLGDGFIFFSKFKMGLHIHKQQQILNGPFTIVLAQFIHNTKECKGNRQNGLKTPSWKKKKGYICEPTFSDGELLSQKLTALPPLYSQCSCCSVSHHPKSQLLTMLYTPPGKEQS